LRPTPTPQSPIPNPQSPSFFFDFIIIFFLIFNIYNNIN